MEKHTKLEVLKKELDRIIELQYNLQMIDPHEDIAGKNLGLSDNVAEETILRLMIKESK